MSISSSPSLYIRFLELYYPFNGPSLPSLPEDSFMDVDVANREGLIALQLPHEVSPEEERLAYHNQNSLHSDAFIFLSARIDNFQPHTTLEDVMLGIPLLTPIESIRVARETSPNVSITITFMTLYAGRLVPQGTQSSRRAIVGGVEGSEGE